MRYTEGATEGEIVGGFNGRGNAEYQVYNAGGVAAVGGEDGDTFYMSDFQNHRVLKWSPGSGNVAESFSATNAEVVFGGHGSSVQRNSFNKPRGVTRAGTVSYICDTDNARVVAESGRLRPSGAAS